MMKKTLVALAATAVTGAFAQVTIYGNIDLGFRNLGSQTTTAALSGIAKNGASTSLFGFTGSEDLGGGLKAGFRLEATISTVDNATSNDAIPSTATAGQFWAGSPFNSEMFVSLSGAFGTVKAGQPNAAVYRLATGIMQPLGTAGGSGYQGTGFSRLGTNTAYSVGNQANGGGSNLRVLRNDRTVQYETPVMNGFSGMVEYAMGNDNITATTAFANNTPSFMGLLANYSAGNLNVGFAMNTLKYGTNKIASAVTTIGTLNTLAVSANSDITFTALGGNYKIGAHTIYAGATTTRASNAAEDSQSWNLGYKFAVNANTDILANTVSRYSNLSGVTSAKSTGFGADYRLSKRTNLYVRYDVIDSNTDNADTGETTTTFVGVRHQF